MFQGQWDIALLMKLHPFDWYSFDESRENEYLYYSPALNFQRVSLHGVN